jgi:hypothetical protein
MHSWKTEASKRNTRKRIGNPQSSIHIATAFIFPGLALPSYSDIPEEDIHPDDTNLEMEIAE